MLRKTLAFALALLMLAAIVSGCAQRRFRAEIPDGESGMAADPAKAGTITAEICGQTYECAYDTSFPSDTTGALCDRYTTGERGRIVIDPETGEVIRFYGITPFEPIDCAAEITDEELISAVRERISSLVDTAKYGESLVTRYPQSESEVNIVVKLYQKDARELNNSVSVTIGPEGDIEDYSRIDGWKDGAAPIDISDEERDALIRSAVEKKITDGKLGEVKLKNELLTLYKGEPALLYWVAAINDRGFDHGLFPVVIYGK